MAVPTLDDQATPKWLFNRILMKRFGESENLFGPVIFLASEASNFVNANLLVVAGT